MALPLFPYQRAAAEVLSTKSRFGLFDGMGLGKTAEIVGALDMSGGRYGIVVCPASARDAGIWSEHFASFSDRASRVCEASNVHDLVAWMRGRFDVLVVSYEQAVQWKRRVDDEALVLDFLVLDEGDYLKNTGSKRTEAILGPQCDGHGGLAQWAKQVFKVTGTPMSNDPIDIYPFLRMVDALRLSKEQFKRRYFSSFESTYGSRNTPRPETLNELQTLIYANSIFRTEKDVGIQLPPITLSSIEMQGDTDDVAALLKNHPGLEGAIINAIERGGLSFLDSQHIATLRRLVGEAKSIPYAHMLADEMAGNWEKQIVFCAHTQALLNVRDALARSGIKCALVHGASGKAERRDAVRAFQTDPSCRVFLGNIRAAGTALTLTAGCRVDMLESMWAPGPNAQAIKRAHRHTQTRPVRARFITLADSIDVAVNRIVIGKTKAIGAIEGSLMPSIPVAA
jgi:SNF2 family DNA or RNA helicase